MARRTAGRRLDPHALLCREFGHPLDPFWLEAGDDGYCDPVFYCRWCGACGWGLPNLIQPLRAAWEVLAVAAWMLRPVGRCRDCGGWFGRHDAAAHEALEIPF